VSRARGRFLLGLRQTSPDGTRPASPSRLCPTRRLHNHRRLRQPTICAGTVMQPALYRARRTAPGPCASPEGAGLRLRHLRGRAAPVLPGAIRPARHTPPPFARPHRSLALPLPPLLRRVTEGSSSSSRTLLPPSTCKTFFQGRFLDRSGGWVMPGVTPLAQRPRSARRRCESAACARLFSARPPR